MPINNKQPTPHEPEMYAANLTQLDALVLFTQERTVATRQD
jgi:hypothetical protein